MKQPKQLKNIDWSWVIGMAEECLLEDWYEDSDNSHYLYEEVMMAVYWENVFDYINQKS